ncbi:MarR family transcriptional regulator [Aggregicoccus sp. 17bor-14]|uniref:MarR family transcriptional regulator n=1 Tax=Myxococcaceae TaxID=31 RepID=UPI00129C893E|nr:MULTISPECIES: MarR family transcriptional regulator [Myxococcaceae]MBF5041824.1 MarR family transcriptional regulator [Simulacricoccus sp. 17bor-14]MRI87605.1 MarR family transcriptional regulator [Aggregicoccus sp. 17bor-14]
MASTTQHGVPSIPEEVPGELRILVARLRQLLVDGTRLGTLGNPLLELPHPQLEPLHLEAAWWLRCEGAVSVNVLAGRMGIPVPRTTRLIDSMEEHGLVLRERNVRNRRLLCLRLTEAGRAAAEEADRWVQRRLAAVLQPLDAGARGLLLGLLEQLVEAHRRAQAREDDADDARSGGAHAY